MTAGPGALGSGTLPEFDCCCVGTFFLFGVTHSYNYYMQRYRSSSAMQCSVDGLIVVHLVVSNEICMELRCNVSQDLL